MRFNKIKSINDIVNLKSRAPLAIYLLLWFLESDINFTKRQLSECQKVAEEEMIINDIIEFCNQHVFKYYKSSFWIRMGIDDYFYLFKRFFQFGFTGLYVLKPFSDEQVLKSIEYVTNFLILEMHKNRSFRNKIKRLSKYQSIVTG